MNLPEIFINRLNQIIPATQLDTVIDSFSYFRLPSIRLNTLKTNSAHLESELQESGIEYEKLLWGDAYIIKNKSTRELTETSLYRQGLFYIQSLSSILVSLILDPQPDEKVLDLTAAPGSKTSHIAALMQNTGEVVANDISRERVFKLKANLENLGVTNTKVINMLGEKVWSQYPEYFDRVLIDAPCSMEGRINLREPHTYEDWSLKKIKKMAKQQKWLLRSAVSSAKVGGVIVYSTCTLAPEENDEVVDWLLKKEQGKVILDDINFAKMELIDGLTQWENKTFLTELTKTKRILPSTTMEGFYIACLRKTTSTVYSK